MCYTKTYAPEFPEVGQIAQSRMGHDKGRLYIITAALSAEFALCADGEYRLLENPKTKRFKHLKILGSSEKAVKAIGDGKCTDTVIKKIIQDFTVTLSR